MKSFLPLFLIGMLLGNSVLSFLHVSSWGAETEGYFHCLAAELQGMGECNAAPETAGFALFHMDAIAGLFLAVVGGFFLALFLLATTSLFLFAVKKEESFRFLHILSRFLLSRRNGYSFDFFPLKRILLRALALRENSPAFV